MAKMLCAFLISSMHVTCVSYLILCMYVLLVLVSAYRHMSEYYFRVGHGHFHIRRNSLLSNNSFYHIVFIIVQLLEQKFLSHCVYFSAVIGA
jgi:hypothetical protein